MSVKTKFEALFEKFCDGHNMEWFRVATSDQKGIKTPDYDISVPDGPLVVVEVKQFDPNPEEKAAILQLRAGRVGDFGGTPGARIRSAITAAKEQLKARSKGKHPALLVVYNNIPECTLHTEPYAILTAMRGLDVISVFVPDDPSIEPIFSPTTRPGPKKEMTPSANTSISAIGVLYCVNAGVPAMDVYHNRFAKIALHHSDLAQVPEIKHLRMRDDQNDWDPLYA